MIKELIFGECDHDGDLDAYVWEVTNSGVEVVGKQRNTRQRTATTEVKVEDEREWQAFLNRFSLKSSSLFLRKYR